MGHPIYLKAKAGGEKSMWEKQGTLEGVYSVALQDPYDRVKAGLPESQSPAVKPHTHGLQRLLGRAIGSELYDFRSSYPPLDGR